MALVTVLTSFVREMTNLFLVEVDDLVDAGDDLPGEAGVGDGGVGHAHGPAPLLGAPLRRGVGPVHHDRRVARLRARLGEGRRGEERRGERREEERRERREER